MQSKIDDVATSVLTSAKANNKYLHAVPGKARIIGVFKEIEVFQEAARLLATTQTHAEIRFYKFTISSYAGSQIAMSLQQVKHYADEEKKPITIRILLNRRGKIAALFYGSNKGTGLETLQKQLNSEFFHLEVAYHTTSAFGSYHAKVISIDDRYLFICGGDPDSGLELKLYETALSLESHELCTASRREFDVLWKSTLVDSESRVKDALQQEELESTIQQINTDHVDVLYVSSQATESPISSERSPFKIAIIQGIFRAQSIIYLMTPNLNDSDVIAALANAINRGVQVYMMMGKFMNEKKEKLWGGTNSSSIEKLVAKLLPDKRRFLHLRWATQLETCQLSEEYGPCRVHAKFCCIDNELLLMGSSPLDNQGMKHSHEVDIVALLSSDQAKNIVKHIFEERYLHGRVSF